jgi:hypothetical protein
MPSPEASLKAHILAHGITFTREAKQTCARLGCKPQGLIYNAPRTADLAYRPQELLLQASDGYCCCVSCIAPVPSREPVRVGSSGLTLHATWGGTTSDAEGVSIEPVPEPSYYQLHLPSGCAVTELVSACGCDELNIWPWYDCAIQQKCSFCGVNTVNSMRQGSSERLSALSLSKSGDAYSCWEQRFRQDYLDRLEQAMRIAMGDECYAEHLHLILISGNLDNSQLDAQALIYADIAQRSSMVAQHRASEGLVAVTAPPRDLQLLSTLHQSGVRVFVCNLEAFSEQAFLRHCPGKAQVGRAHYLKALEESVNVFGTGRTWTNFVLGLEAPAVLLDGCARLADSGIVPGANVLHLDMGGKTDLAVPDVDSVLWFYSELASLYHQHNMRPFYCAKALRTSLTNEAYDGRLK